MQTKHDDLLDDATVLSPEEVSGLNEVVAAQANVALHLEAHPGEKLLAHCLQVALYAQRLIRERPIRLPEGFSNRALEKLAFLAGAFHDFGKATNRFQLYLHTNDWREKEKFKADPLTRHALLGAVVAYIVLKQSDLDKELQATSLGRVLRLAPFWVIRRHHGNLLYPERDLSLGLEEINLLSQQLDDCDVAEFDFIIKQVVKVGGFTLHKPVTRALLKDEIQTLYLDIGCDGQDISSTELERLKNDKIGALAPWLLVQQLFSVLLDADKSYAAVEIRKPVNDHGMNPDWVTQYRASKFKTTDGEGVNAWRTEVAGTAAEIIKTTPLNTVFFNLTLPTGLGKTLIALDCALHLRVRLQSQTPHKRTIIYALPFLSILEQAASVYDELFASALGNDKRNLPSEIMIRHHHLAELRYVKGEVSGNLDRDDDQREFNPNQSQLMIEGWRSALVMTSAVQLFQSLFAGRNRSTRKLHRLAGAIVVLDEIQSIPFKYWPLMRRAMRALNSLFDTRFLLVTATQPRFLEGEDGDSFPTIELVPNYQTYFARLNRTITTVDLKLLTVGAFADAIAAKLNGEHHGQDTLIVVNTVATAVNLFHLLADKFAATHEVVHLSTNIIPDARTQRIAYAKDRSNRPRPLIVVSTQLVEAGVDFSFPVLFRDFAPFPAIVQAAGRCNRNGEYEVGNVYVHSVTTDNGKRLADFIYDTLELNKTEEVMKSLPPQLNEHALIEGIEAYFKAIQPLSTQESLDVLNGAMSLCFKPKSKGENEALESFRLIKDEQTQEVFIEIDGRAAEAWRAYNALQQEAFNPSGALEESFLRAAKLRAALINCRPFMLSVSIKYFHDEERAAQRKDEICYYAQTEFEQVYDREIGWIRTKQE